MIYSTGTNIALLFISLLSAASIPASAIQIELKSTQYSTYVARGELSGLPFETRTNFSSSPISDLFTCSDVFRPVESQADANLFRIFTLADATQHQIFRGYAKAIVSTEFTFSPTADASTLLDLDFFTTGQYVWGGNEVSLFDITTGTSLWSYYYHGLGGGTIPWAYDESRRGMAASLSLPTELFSSHDYRFRMASWGSSNNPDSDVRTTQVFGLESTSVVPEPSALALTSLATAALLNSRRKRG